MSTNHVNHRILNECCMYQAPHYPYQDAVWTG